MKEIFCSLTFSGFRFAYLPLQSLIFETRHDKYMVCSKEIIIHLLWLKLMCFAKK